MIFEVLEAGGCKIRLRFRAVDVFKSDAFFDFKDLVLCERSIDISKALSDGDTKEASADVKPFSSLMDLEGHSLVAFISAMMSDSVKKMGPRFPPLPFNSLPIP
jgi:hypothetical protein